MPSSGNSNITRDDRGVTLSNDISPQLRSLLKRCIDGLYSYQYPEYRPK